MTKFQALIREFNNSVLGLEAALNEHKTEFTRDSAIKRFELAFDLSWKTIKAFLEEKGVVCVSPIGCFREAFRQNLIDFEDSWIKMVKTRNNAVHTYNEALAEEIYADLKRTPAMFKKLISAIEAQNS